VNKPGESSPSLPEEDQLLEIANDGGLKRTFHATTLLVFWIKIKVEYFEIAQKSSENPASNSNVISFLQ